MSRSSRRHDRREALALQAALVADDATVLAAIRDGVSTWADLHAYFPLTQHGVLSKTLDTLCRAGRVRRYAAGAMGFHAAGCA